jgi:hypothetical protein
LIFGLCGVLVGCSLNSHAARPAPGDATAGAASHILWGGSSVTLVGQRGTLVNGRRVRWNTTLPAIAIRCPTGHSRAELDPAASVCAGVVYFIAHRSTAPCTLRTVIGPYLPERVLISGRVNGRPVRSAMGLVCNPPPLLASAVGSIYSAAFRPTPQFGNLQVRRIAPALRNAVARLRNPSVTSGALVLTTRWAIGLGGPRAASIWVLQAHGRFSLSGHTARYAQIVLDQRGVTFRAVRLDLSQHPVDMALFGGVVPLTWKAG